MQNKDNWKETKYFLNNGKIKLNLKHINSRSVFLNFTILKAYHRIINKYSSGLLLDCGCGHVPYYSMYKNLVKDNYCVDWDTSSNKNQYLDKIANLNESIPYQDDMFDTVLLTDVLEHISNPKNLVSEINRVLKKGGKVIITVPFFYWIHEPPHDFFRYTEFSLTNFCEENNLKIIELESYGGLPDVMLDLFNKAFISNPHIAKLYLSFCKIISGTFFYKRFRKNTLRSFPLGYYLVAEKM
ncbi:methyltransferase domain-containing protein [Flexithrix dorotheae]|uniref:methyltransferase domain-containing protein n=1 Tax=Flexithrix dorotheae TaxID=70993 RepID=UPI00036E1EA3|nr:class I SAM-dependent methyltransferase [Flexithrix dorotheae]